jgi:hypothetical protein
VLISAVNRRRPALGSIFGSADVGVGYFQQVIE